MYVTMRRGAIRGGGLTMPSCSVAGLMPANLRSYQIRLEDIRFRGKHGVSASERSLPQDFSVSVEVSLPVGRLPGTDTVREVFDYDRLASLVVAEGTGQPCKLLETLARRVIDRI